ncbi:hypothetical protein GMOD_00007503 [Pyrenophora seminiperda CCB06]|uniref:Uncharacterized protein n=1 Tax=Pyrenophora seminiperda CCB06 TaxID=1302712 RepID=A0A3M7MDE8_9PLEO|nr:hypothetical protein GMOD_00007503 [Pyrenophora seminiperda CCB06]
MLLQQLLHELQVVNLGITLLVDFEVLTVLKPLLKVLVLREVEPFLRLDEKLAGLSTVSLKLNAVNVGVRSFPVPDIEHEHRPIARCSASIVVARVHEVADTALPTAFDASEGVAVGKKRSIGEGEARMVP